MIIESLHDLAVDIDTLKVMPGNPRQGNVAAVKKSYEQFGQRKPIVATKDGTVIAGNHQLLAARELGWDEIAVVFVDDDDKTAKAFALADNRTSDLGTYDNEALAELLADVAVDPELLLSTGYTEDNIEALLGEVSGDGDGHVSEFADLYSKVVNRPTYEIVGDQPDTSELFDADKAEQLRSDILAADLPDDLQEFLVLATYRHVVFNYGKIAEYYPHQSKEVQQLMEDSALVIIDYQDAIEKGYVTLSDAVLKLIEEDQDDES